MSVSTLVVGLEKLTADILDNPRDDIQIAKDILDLFLASGLDASILSGYLTDADARSAEANADIREEAKLRILEAEKSLKE